MQPNTVINILGQRIVLKTKETDPLLIDEILELVAAHIKRAENKSKIASPQQVMLLALLELGEEHIRAKRRVSSYKNEIHEKSEKLMSLLNQNASH